MSTATTTTTDPDPKSKCRLLMLPAELRLRIYEEVLSYPTISYVDVFSRKFRDRDYTPVLFKICTQIYWEAADLYKARLKTFPKIVEPFMRPGHPSEWEEKMDERLELVAAMERAKLFGEELPTLGKDLGRDECLDGRTTFRSTRRRTRN